MDQRILDPRMNKQSAQKRPMSLWGAFVRGRDCQAEAHLYVCLMNAGGAGFTEPWRLLWGNRMLLSVSIRDILAVAKERCRTRRPASSPSSRRGPE
jgi:hypothetical protein